MSVRSSLKAELGPLLKKGLRGYLQPSESIAASFYIDLDRQLTAFFERHPELDREADVREAITASLAPIADTLTASVKTLQNLVSSYGEVQKGKMLAREVRVRSKGRATLSMFPPGTRLRVTELRRMDGSLGGVQLIVKE